MSQGAGGYPRLTRPPLNLQTEEILGAVVERLLKSLRELRTGDTVTAGPRRFIL